MRSVLILLSTYNGSKYLNELLDSLASQKDVDVSVLARDDGSNDNTVEILERYSAKMKLSHYSGKNLRSAGSFMDLINSAPENYDYYAFCDQDDYWEADKLISAVEKLEETDSLKPALYYSGQKLTDEELNIVHNHALDTNRSARGRFFFNQAAGCTVVFNKTLLKLMKSFPNALPQCHDTYTVRLCAALGGGIVVESQGHILYRQHGSNVVGLDYSLKGKWRLFKRHIRLTNARTDSEEILKGYGPQLSEEWRKYLSDITNARKSFRAKLRLLTDKQVYFGSAALRITYIVKVLSGSM